MPPTSPAADRLHQGGGVSLAPGRPAVVVQCLGRGAQQPLAPGHQAAAGGRGAQQQVLGGVPRRGGQARYRAALTGQAVEVI